MASPSEILALAVTFVTSAGLTTAVLRERRSLPRRIRRALRRRFPGCRVTREPDHWLLAVDDRTVRVPITRILDAREFGDARVEAEIVHCLAETDRALRRAPATVEAELPLDRLVPVLLPDDRAERIGEGARFTVPLGDGVSIGFAVDEPSADRWLTLEDGPLLDTELDTLLARSLDNLRSRSDGVAVLREDEPGREVYVIRHGDGLDGSRMLLHDLWEDIAEVAGDDLLLCAPTRDRVYAAPAGQPSSIDRMVRHVSEDWVYRPHGVSPRIWVYNGNRLVPWSMHS